MDPPAGGSGPGGWIQRFAVCYRRGHPRRVHEPACLSAAAPHSHRGSAAGTVRIRRRCSPPRRKGADSRRLVAPVSETGLSGLPGQLVGTGSAGTHQSRRQDRSSSCRDPIRDGAQLSTPGEGTGVGDVHRPGVPARRTSEYIPGHRRSGERRGTRARPSTMRAGSGARRGGDVAGRARSPTCSAGTWRSRTPTACGCYPCPVR